MITAATVVGFVALALIATALVTFLGWLFVDWASGSNDTQRRLRHLEARVERLQEENAAKKLVPKKRGKR